MSIETVLRFAELGLPAPILRAVEELGYESPSPIQARAIPPLVAGRDLLGRAQTGTGKTAAFALPLLAGIDAADVRTQALVLVPTRELAIQVAEAIHAYARYLDELHVLPIYGGQPIGAQLRPLRRGVQVVVGTPGRIIDHLERGTLRLDAVRAVVLDEADEMLRMGFIEDVDRILEQAPAERQVALFSATMPPAVRRVAERHLRDPEIVTIEAATSTVEAIDQHFIVVPWRQKLDVLTRVLETTEYDGMLVFVRTKLATVEVAEKLEARGHAAACLNGDMTQALRERTVQRLKDGKLDIVVATDVAARGLDVDRITHVVNYDIPADPEAYVHRIGRTGRAGRTGTALLFVQPREQRMLKAIERSIGQAIPPYAVPTVADVTDQRVRRFRETLLAALEEGTDRGFFDRVLAPLRAEHGHSIEDIAAALADLLQADRPLQPEPAEIEVFAGATEIAPPRGRADRADRSPRADRDRDLRPPHAGDERTHRRERGRTPAGGGGMMPYRVDLGRRHGLRAGHLVGALTNEGGLTGADIGRIEIHEHHALLGLDPDRVARDLPRLAAISVLGRPLGLRPEREGAGPRGDRDRRDPRERHDQRGDRPHPARGTKPRMHDDRGFAARPHGRPEGRRDEAADRRPAAKPSARRLAFEALAFGDRPPRREDGGNAPERGKPAKAHAKRAAKAASPAKPKTKAKAKGGKGKAAKGKPGKGKAAKRARSARG